MVSVLLLIFSVLVIIRLLFSVWVVKLVGCVFEVSVVIFVRVRVCL